MTRWIRCGLRFTIALGICSGIQGAPALAQETVTAHAIVTAVTRRSEGPTAIPQASITLLAGGKRQDVSAWTPLRGDRAGLELVLLLDDSSGSGLSLQLNDIRNFIHHLPPETKIAIGYMRNGSANLVEPFTSDHQAAIQALRMPLGTPGGNGSPYFCLSDLIKRWPAGGNVRREVIMVTDGIDRYSGRAYDPQNPYLQKAIQDAQKAGVIVYSIYFRGRGGLDRSSMATDGGMNYLVQVSDATGGKAYYQGFGDPVSFEPFLSDIQHKLENQYELSFVAAPRKDLLPIRVKTTEPNTKLQAPAQVAVTASSY